MGVVALVLVLLFMLVVIWEQRNKNGKMHARHWEAAEGVSEHDMGG